MNVYEEGTTTTTAGLIALLCLFPLWGVQSKETAQGPDNKAQNGSKISAVFHGDSNGAAVRILYPHLCRRTSTIIS